VLLETLETKIYAKDYNVIEAEYGGLGVMVFNATFNSISVISWRSILLLEETGVPGENHRPVASH
jgi:hypothetical protein